MKQRLVNENVERDFYLTCRRLAQDAIHHPDFFGIGMILYDPDIFDHSMHKDLRPSIPCPKDVSLGEEKTLSLLFEIADKSNKLHDGFHFFDYTSGLMTHVAQYFFPPIVPKIDVNENYGTRYHSAQYGSCIEGIILTGAINSDNQYHIFRKGRLVQENEFEVKL
jgi:hypothetical protein